MEKRNIFRLCLLLVVGLWAFIQPVVSAPITRQKALRNVNEFLQERGVRIHETAIRHAPIKSNEQETAPYYVFNLGDDNGFVIASGDDCAYEILGYSDKGSFDADNIPENVQAWLDGYAKEIEWGRENNVSSLKTAKAGPAKKSVEPLLTTRWGQNSPYNDQCVFNGVVCKTGCAATAMAQLMYYWAKIGKDGKTFRCGSTGMRPYLTRTNSYQVDSIPPLDSFGWDNMTDGEPTTAEGKQAVAQLMRYCGQAQYMDYNCYESDSYTRRFASALIDIFGYSWNMLYISSDDMSSEEWDSLIYDNLAKGLPVSMFGKSGQGTGGHAFLCDGYDSQLDKYHFNWGWDGRYDGFYSMSALTPNRNNYSYNKTATIDILPFGNRGYAILSPDSTVLTVYNDTKKDQREGFFYRIDIDEFHVPNIGAEARKKLKEVIFDPSCVDYYPYGWVNPFFNLPNLTTITGLEYFNTSRVTDMHGMFYGCKSLESLDVSHFNTKNVTDMSTMFKDCSSLKELDTSGFNTSKVVKMGSMFYGCKFLESLDVSHFNTQNVTDMSLMFGECSSLKELDTSGFNTSKVVKMGSMFYGCKFLESLDVSHFNTKNVTDMSNMFVDCSSLKALDTSGFNTSKVEKMGSMFYFCKFLESLDVSHFNTKNVTDMSNMFSGCSSLKELDTSGFNTSKVEKMGSMFYGCKSLESLDVSKFDTQNVKDMSWMFVACSSLKALDTSGFNTSKVEKMGSMFYGCKSLESLDVSHFNTQNVTDMSSMFGDCSSLKELDTSGFNTSKVEKMGSMFYGCKSLESLDVSKFDTQNVKDMSWMFVRCSALQKLDLSSFDLTNVTNIDKFMSNCKSLKKLKISASMDKLEDDAFRYIGGAASPCEIFAPADFDFKTDTSGNYFIWKSGYFCIGKMWSLPGDVNSDDIVDITDVVRTANYILGNTSGQFDRAAADMNGDGVIDVSDLTSIVNYILDPK